MNVVKSLALAALVAVGVSAALVRADFGTPRQYYGGWNKHPSKNYYYNHYYYKPTPDYAGYKHHYAIYYPSRPDHYYYYNPHKKVFWGRCPISTGGVGQYSLLPETARKPTIEEIPEKDFPKPGPLPKIPDTNVEKEPNPPTLDLPPDKPAPTQSGKIDQGEDLP
jgi:hypothetical protein